MRINAIATACLLMGCVAGAPEVPAARSDALSAPALRASSGAARLQGDSARELARTLFSGFHQRIVETQENRSGPGAVLTHISLYEQPQTTHLQGLCEVVVHDVGVPFAPPPNDPPRTATWVRTGTRYLSIGDVGPTIPPAGQEHDCAELSTGANFFSAPSRETAHSALQTYTSVRRWARARSNEVVFDCAALTGACPEPDTLFGQILTPYRITAVEELACEPGRPGRGTRCFTYHFNAPGGVWSVSIKGPERPAHIRAWQSVPPVS